MNTPQIKICGLTEVTQALACAELGADAIGLVFFTKSPRNLTLEKARDIGSALSGLAVATGVFVNETFEGIMEKVEKCSLKAVQLHGRESPDLVSRLRNENLTVIKALYMECDPHVSTARQYDPDGFLVECAKGVLPGGNALSWNFERVRELDTDKPVLIAGGLSLSNIYDAVSKAKPDAVDVSSGVEQAPGLKDLDRVKAFITTVRQTVVTKSLRRVF